MMLYNMHVSYIIYAWIYFIWCRNISTESLILIVVFFLSYPHFGRQNFLREEWIYLLKFLGIIKIILPIGASNYILKLFSGRQFPVPWQFFFSRSQKLLRLEKLKLWDDRHMFVNMFELVCLIRRNFWSSQEVLKIILLLFSSFCTE